MKCGNCGHEIDSSDKFCENCGNKIIKDKLSNGANNKYCSQCGALISENSSFCTICGCVVGDVSKRSYNLFLIFGYMAAFGVLFIDTAILGVICSVPIGLYLMTGPETQEYKILYLHGVLLVVMPLVFFIIRIFFL